MKGKSLVKFSLIGSGILAFLIVVLSIIPFSVSCSSKDSDKIGANQPPVILNEHIKALNDAYISASNAIVPTVVSISVTIENKSVPNPLKDQWKDFFRFFGESPNDGEDDMTPRKSEASGSGVFVSDDGYIVTNNHVVENASEIHVTTNDRKEYKAKLIGRDPNTDLALIKIEGSGFQPAYLGDMTNVKVGEIVMAVGNPLGLNSTVTSGIVSAIGRGGLNLYSAKRGLYAVENFIQTDAAINPGNSGGGLYSLEGALIGINTAIATRTGSYIGYGFAIPVDIVKTVIIDLREHGKVNRGFIGVNIKTIDDVEAKAVGLDQVNGVMVNNVVKESPAEKAGIEPGDIILDLDGQPLKTSNELQSRVVMHKAGDVVKLTLWRNGNKIYKDVKLEPINTEEEEPKIVAGEENNQNDELNAPVKFDNLGFAVEPLTSEIKKTFNVKEGVFISKIDNYGIAAERGLSTNGVIVKADRTLIASPEQLKKLIKSKKSGEAILLHVKYKDTDRIVAIQIP
ncbi:MAG: Do family serine endopeptidase [FCB group bacterium]|jgi:serine protease Do